jgi:hypothetical protein
MNDNANGANADDLADSPKMNNVLSRLGSLGERSRLKNTRPAIQQVAQLHVELPSIPEIKEPIIEQEIVSESTASRAVDSDNVKQAKILAEQVIPESPLRLKGVTNFTPENMYDQVRNDYMGIVHQSINGALDNLAAFYIQGNRFEASKDMKIFLMKALEKNIQSLKSQYVAKYPLINGLEQTISQVEKTEANAFKRVVQDFLSRMVGNTFS